MIPAGDNDKWVSLVNRTRGEGKLKYWSSGVYVLNGWPLSRGFNF